MVYIFDFKTIKLSIYDTYIYIYKKYKEIYVYKNIRKTLLRILSTMIIFTNIFFIYFLLSQSFHTIDLFASTLLIKSIIIFTKTNMFLLIYMTL